MLSLQSPSTATLEKSSAIICWALVTLTMLFFMTKRSDTSVLQTALVAFFCCSYLLMWLKTTSETEIESHTTKCRIFMVLMFINIAIIFFLSPYTYAAILTVMWCALTPYFMSIRLALLVSPLWSIPLWAIYRFYWGENYAVVTAGLFWTFNLFAIITMNTSIKEKKARLEAQQMNIELQSTQQLLKQAAEQAERTRIARNIHDLLGHHLTALTINLQVASRQLAGQNVEVNETLKTIDQCHSLAKLLLSDVREAVSDIRDGSRIDLAATLEAITQAIKPIRVNLNIANKLQLNNFAMAESVVRIVQEAVTNTLKHSQATEMTIDIQQSQHKLTLIIQDNGEFKAHWQEGNGLTGIRERVELMRGSTDIGTTPQGFSISITIPLVSHD